MLNFIRPFISLQVWPQEGIDEHDDCTKLTSHPVSFGSIVHSVSTSAAGHGFCLCVGGIRCIRIICRAGRRKVGDNCWSV